MESDPLNYYRTKRGPGPFSCLHCGKKYTNYFVFRKHNYMCRKTVLIPFPKTCDICGIHFRSAAHHALHIKKKAYCRPLPFTCESCGRIFQNVHKLLNHERRKTPCSRDTVNQELTPTHNSHTPSPTKVSSKAVSIEEEADQLLDELVQNDSMDKRSAISKSICPTCDQEFDNYFEYQEHVFANECMLRPRAAKKEPKLEPESPPPSPIILPPKNAFSQSQNSFTSKKILKKYKKNYFHAPKSNSFSKSKSSPVINNPPKYICDLCHKSYSSLTSLENHKLESHEQIFELPKCPSPDFSSAMMMPTSPNVSSTIEHWPSLKQSRTQECFCPFCQKRFLYLRSRNRHVQRHHPENPQRVRDYLEQTTCQYCLRLFPTEQAKQTHVQLEHTGVATPTKPLPILDPYRPQLPKKKFRKAVDITPELAMKLKKYPNQCAICGKQYCNTFVRDRHLKCHTLEKPFECEWCAAKFMRSEHLTQHLQAKHSEVLGFQCKACGLKFPTRVRTSQHISKIHKDVPRDSLMIELKESKMSISRDVEKENKRETPPPRRYIPPLPPATNGGITLKEEPGRGIYSCTICDIGTFSKMNTLKKHLKSKQHKDNLILLNCTKTSSKSSSSSVEEPKLYICSVCHTNFDSARKFIPHRLGHFNLINYSNRVTNVFECEICSQVFSQPEKIQMHLLNHMQTEKSPSKTPAPKTYKFHCKKCNSGFSTKQHLTVHEKRHCPVKYICGNCGQKFSSIKPYSAHKNYCQALKCQYCSLVMDSNSDLVWHEKSCVKVSQTLLPTDETKEEGVENELKSLRENFSQLLYLLVGDAQLMTKLGWGERPIEDVLADVLQHMGKSPDMSGEKSELDLLRSNISYLLQISIQDELFKSESIVDKLVAKVLAMFDTS